MRIVATFAVFMLLSGCVTVEQEQPIIFKAVEPTHVGEALPSPKIPLRDITRLAGPVPKYNSDTIQLFTRNFEKLVFEFESGYKTKWVHKWNKTVQWYMPIRDYKIMAAFHDAEDLLQKITGLDIWFGLSHEGKIYSIQVRKGAVELGKVVGDERHCFVTMESGADGSYQKARVYIGRLVDPSFYKTCALEELSQLLGPANDTTLVEHSMWRPYSSISLFNSRTYGTLTWHDAIILRVLYNERIKPGMHKDDAMPIVRELIEKELRDLNAGQSSQVN